MPMQKVVTVSGEPSLARNSEECVQMDWLRVSASSRDAQDSSLLRNARAVKHIHWVHATR